LTPLSEKVQVRVEGRTVNVAAWRYDVAGISGRSLPVILLDTNVTENGEYDRGFTSSLYGGDEKYRFAQEMVLGIGGVKMLRKLGYTA
jgi:starch phosphorylase